MSDSNSRLVYSTQTGRIEEPKTAPVRPKGDGIVRIQRQTSGRKGKGVCLITGIEMNDAELTKLTVVNYRGVKVNFVYFCNPDLKRINVLF